jgi:hypothetical protein
MNEHAHRYLHAYQGLLYAEAMRWFLGASRQSASKRADTLVESTYDAPLGYTDIIISSIIRWVSVLTILCMGRATSSLDASGSPGRSYHRALHSATSRLPVVLVSSERMRKQRQLQTGTGRWVCLRRHTQVLRPIEQRQ